MNNIADLLDQATAFESTGEYAKAERCYLRALELKENTFGFDHPELATDLHNAGLLLFAQDKYEEAERLLRRELTIEEKHFGPDHPELLSTLEHLAAVYFNQERYEESELAYRRLIELFERYRPTPTANSPAGSLNRTELINHYHNLAEICELQGKADDVATLKLRMQKLLDAQLSTACRTRNN